MYLPQNVGLPKPKVSDHLVKEGFKHLLCEHSRLQTHKTRNADFTLDFDAPRNGNLDFVHQGWSIQDIVTGMSEMTTMGKTLKFQG